MTTKAVVTALAGDGVKAITRLVNLIGVPALNVLLLIAVNQFNILLNNQEKAFEMMAEHDRKLTADSTAIGKLFKNDRLIVVKQDAAIDALNKNSEIGIEFNIDYERKYTELFRENQFLNP